MTSNSSASQFSALKQNPIRGVIAVLLIGILLTIPAGFWVVYKNIEQHWQSAPKIALYLAMGTTQDQAQDLQNKLKQRSDVADAALISPLQGLQDLIAATGLDQVLARLSYNPLPIVLEVSPSAEVDSSSAIDKLTTDLRAESLVETVQVNTNLAKYHFAALSFWQRLITLVTILFIILIPLYFVNLLQILMQNQQNNSSQNALPTSIFIGICSALLAWLLTALIFAWLSGPLLNWLSFQITGFGFLLGLILLSVGVLFAVLSAAIINVECRM